ncbi:G-protein coupled receptor Mth2-like isoform X2 [Periplaneta americana]
MISTCPSDWKDPNTRFRCEHPDTNFRDPLLDSPITSYMTNITYRNWHCASCHGDLAADSSFIWPVYFVCGSTYVNINDEEFIDHLEYNTTAQRWTLNMTEKVDYLLFETVDKFRPDRHIYSCDVVMSIPRIDLAPVRDCKAAVVDSCPDNWTDTSVRTQCEAFTSYLCSDEITYRNYYCGVCNNNGSFDGDSCSNLYFDVRIMYGYVPPGFSILLDWRSLSKREICWQETEKYDPFTKSCRKVFIETEVTDTIPGNNSNESRADLRATNSSSDFATCSKIMLEPEDYVIVDNDTMDVLLMAYNITLEPSEYIIQNDSKILICIPFDYDTDELNNYPLSYAYTTIVGVSFSVAFIIIHLVVFLLTPKLRNLSSMNLASLSVALLLMYCAFVAGSYLLETDVPCIVVAAITYYGLLAAFTWMFTIAYDISRVLRQTTTRFAIMSGKHWQRFAFYSVCSWLLPAVIVGAALGADFSNVVPEDLRPGFGVKHCWFSNTYSLLIFGVAPLLVVMVLNVIFFAWSAYLVYTSAKELRHNSTTHQDFRLYARLALIMGLTWIIGLIAGYVDSEVVWYLFILFNTLQGLFIFCAFTCTKKIWNALSKEHGLFPINIPSQKTRRSPFAGTATTLT